MPQFRSALHYAWLGSAGRWDALPLQAAGSAIGGLLFWYLGWKLPQAILDNPALSALASIVIGGIVGVIFVFMLRLCWWPVYWRLEPHGGLAAFLHARLGTFMWPVVLITGGFAAFVLLTGGGVIWLSLQVLNGPPIGVRTSETPNTVGNPDFALFVPEGRYRFTWPASNLMAFYLRLDSERNPSISNNPTFTLRNLTNTVAYSVTAIWKSETSLDLEKTVKTSPRLSKAKFDIKDYQIAVIGTKDLPFGNFFYPLDPSPQQTIPVIAKEAEIYLPLQIWPLAAIYFVDKLPDGIGETSPPFVAIVSLNWETSEGKRQRSYRVRITATNAKSSNAELPIVDAYLNFSLEEIPQ